MGTVRRVITAALTSAILVTGAGVGEASAASSTAVASRTPTAANPTPKRTKEPLEPHSWNLWCRDIYGSVYYVSNPADCTRGNVKFISTYSGKVDATMDVGALYYKINRSYSLNDAYNDCGRYIVCGLLRDAVSGFVLSKLKIAWIAIRRIKGIFSAPEAMTARSRQVPQGAITERSAHAAIST